jgi:hypothetical protein
VIRSRATPSRTLVEQIREGDRAEDDGPAARELRSSSSWRLVHQLAIVALYSADISVFERVRGGAEPAPVPLVERRSAITTPRR